MAAPREPTVYTIPARRPFADALALGLMRRDRDGEIALARARILLPTRRACLTLRDAFLRAGTGRAMLLPRLIALGDLDEDPLLLAEAPGLGGADLAPAMPGPRRVVLLARLVRAAGRRFDAERPDQAVRLAGELARLLDQMQTEGVPLERLGTLVPAEFARHWQDTLAFLDILRDAWPKLLAAEDALDPAARRNRLIDAQRAAWEADPPDDPILAAGSTGSIPATADLLATVARLPRGAVVLPGLDRLADDAQWAAIAADQSHPQYGLARLLERLGVAREAVAEWPAPASAEAPEPAAPDRACLAMEMMRPAAATSAWAELAGRLPADCLDGLNRLTARTQAEEAAAIAILMREALETPGRTAALVTPDRILARRVKAELARWAIAVDDSAGEPLAGSPPGAFLRLVLEAVRTELAPVALLALLKHPLTGLGLDPADARARARRLDKLALRGVRPAAGIAGLRGAIAGVNAETPRRALGDLADRLERALAPLIGAMAGEIPAEALIVAHIRAAEALAATPREAGAARLWRGEDGETLARFLGELREALVDLGCVPGGGYPALFDALIEGQVARPTHGTHPRLGILGPLEARLQRADRVILGGLNEGVWPPEPAADPWLSRPMRAALGLPLPERRVGLSAHDFTQALAGAEVWLTRAEKIDGQPTTPSRWLTRLNATLRAAELEDALSEDTRIRAWAASLADPGARIDIAPPAPRPPAKARPPRLSVSGVERLRRDPYSVFARYILGLSPLDPLEADPGAADRGTVIHAALERFFRAHPPPDPLPPDAAARLRAEGRAAFGAVLDRPAIQAFWWPRFERIADFVLAREAERRARGLVASHVEAAGRWVLPTAIPFEVTAKADRLDESAGGGLTVIDYKTGRPPSQKEIEAGFSPQLPLEALIARNGGFPGLRTRAIEALEYWRLGGGEPAGEIKPVAGDLDALIDATEAGLLRLVETFQNPATPYRARPTPSRFWPRFGDYDHLARLGEWRPGGAGEEA